MGDNWRTVSRLEPADFYADWLQQSQRIEVTPDWTALLKAGPAENRRP